ncbi:hypothetical protein Tco_0570600 [Tanacetum coccineum]
MLGRKRVGKEQQQESSKKLKVEKEKESDKMIIDYKLLKEGMMIHYQLIREDGSSKRYSSMIRMLQGIDREDLEALWRIVKAKYGDTRPENEFKKSVVKKLEDSEDEHQVSGRNCLGLKRLHRFLEVTTAQDSTVRRLSTVKRIIDELKNKDCWRTRLLVKR